MRRVVTIVSLSAVGFHCATAVDDEAIVVDDAPPIPSREDEEPKAPPREEPSPVRGAISREYVAPSLPISSEIVAEGGARYVAGVFSGTMALGAVRLKSRGEDDVFVARFERGGELAWARSVGGVSKERGPRLRFEGSGIQLAATTRGPIDCGTGQLPSWSSEMLFLCFFDPLGTPNGGVVYPIGALSL